MKTPPPHRFHHRPLLGPTLLLMATGFVHCSDLNDPSERDYDVVSYDLHAIFDWEADRLSATEEIHLILGEIYKTKVEFDSNVEIKRVYQENHDLSYTVNAEEKTLQIDLSSIASWNGEYTFRIDYEAKNRNIGLFRSDGPDNDPVKSRVIYTLSEPDRGSSWLVGNHRPYDRARWAVQFIMTSDEDLIANGHRVEEDIDTNSGRKRVRYEIEQPIPTYLMAFAMGELVHQDDMVGDTPISLWHRRGLQIDPQKNLQVVKEGMEKFQRLMGPYPWDSYAVVLLPELGGGIEHATITFNYELSGQAPVARWLNDHELAHQWMGDWVTIESFDDLWIKEGMATLLESEAQRSYRDQSDQGRLFGLDFNFNPQDAIRDTELEPAEKYTTGPYPRAAWLLTQIRSIVGEESFWHSIRTVLDKYALRAISSEDFIQHFELNETQMASVFTALDAKGAPTFDLMTTSSQSDTQVNLTLKDPTKTLIAPLEVSVIEANHGASIHTLEPETPLDLHIPKDGYLALGEHDIHPVWSNIAVELASIAVPTNSKALDFFEQRSAAHQERGIGNQLFPDDFAFKFSQLYDQLDSTYAQALASVSACHTLASLPSEISSEFLAWLAVTTPTLRSSVYPIPGQQYGRCGQQLPKSLFEDELVTLISSFDLDSVARIQYLLNFDYGEERSLQLIQSVLDHAPNRKLRTHALRRAAWHTHRSFGYSLIDDDRRIAWQQLFRSALSEATTPSTRWFWSALTGVIALKDRLALPILGERILILNSIPNAQLYVICQAYQLAGDDTTAWSGFQQAAQPWTALSQEAQEALANPSLCDENYRSVPSSPLDPLVKTWSAPRLPHHFLSKSRKSFVCRF